jgi:hypothetical protein
MSLPKWPSRKALLRSAAVLFIVLAGLFGTIAPAQAAPTRDTELGQVQTLATGGVFCGGSIRIWASTNPDWGDRSILNAQALPMGIGSGSANGSPSGSSIAANCSVQVRVAWRNVSNGRTGEWRFGLTAGPYGSMQYALFQPTGKGRIVTDVTTDQLNIPCHGEYDVF